MDLPIDIITMDSLMKRWEMSFMDIVLVVVNHELSPVYKEYQHPNWKKASDLDQDILAPFFDPKADPSQIVFLKSDIEQIETEFDGHVSKSSEIIHEKHLIKRLGISLIELWNLQEAQSIDIYDSLGVRIDDTEIIKAVPALIPGGG